MSHKSCIIWQAVLVKTMFKPFFFISKDVHIKIKQFQKQTTLSIKNYMMIIKSYTHGITNDTMRSITKKNNRKNPKKSKTHTDN